MNCKVKALGWNTEWKQFEYHASRITVALFSLSKVCRARLRTRGFLKICLRMVVPVSRTTVPLYTSLKLYESVIPCTEERGEHSMKVSESFAMLVARLRRASSAREESGENVPDG